MKVNVIKEYIINIIYFILIFIFSIAVATQALARKVNTFQTMTSPIFFYVDKQDIAVVATITGQVEELLVSPGQYVDKGELVMKISMSNYDKKIEALEAVADGNLSARTELSILKEKADSFNVYAPQNGVIYKVQVSEGSYVGIGTEVATLFADSDAKLLTYVTPAQYTELQSKPSISVYSKRLEQAFSVKLNGIGKVTDDYQSIGGSNTKRLRKYELIFQFVNPEDGAVFIEQESLQFINVVSSNNIQRPMERVARLWNALILGK